MIYASEGTVETLVYSEQNLLTNWTITITGKKGRDITTETIAMVVLIDASRRYYLKWICPSLSQIEYDYEIKSDVQIIDKGILRKL
tara:strand:+ start:3379 stop:3636 length:258 start_codon:yes stop_codon:yes gene_type:complete